jgi:hypothetical protein
VLVTETIRHTIERKELQDLREQLEIERANRVEYERNVSSFVDELLREKNDRVPKTDRRRI